MSLRRKQPSWTTPAPTAALVRRDTDDDSYGSLHSTAIVLAQIEWELNRLYSAQYVNWSGPVRPTPKRTDAREYLKGSGLLVWEWLVNLGIELDVRDPKFVNEVGPEQLSLLRYNLDGMIQTADATADLDKSCLPTQAASLFKVLIDLELNTERYSTLLEMEEMVAKLSKRNLVEVLGSILEDATVVSYEFANKLPNAKWRMFHPDMKYTLDPNIVSFWNVVMLANWNTITMGRSARGYDTHLHASMQAPMELRPTLQVARKEAENLNASPKTVMLLDERAQNFDPRMLNRLPNTKSQWPRCNSALLYYPEALTLLSVLPVRLTHYPEDALLFHGTLRNSLESIDNRIEFGRTGGNLAMGFGFYCTSNFNEAKSYALARLNTECKARAEKVNKSPAGSTQVALTGADMRNPAHSVGTPLSDLDVATVCVFHLKDAGKVQRVFTNPPGEEHLHNRSFRLNPLLHKGNQYVLHGGCEQSLTLVQVHDIDARGDVWHTNIFDTAHNVDVGLEKSGPFRGVESAKG